VGGVFSIGDRRSVNLRGEFFVYGDIKSKCLRPGSSLFKLNFKEIVTLAGFSISL
jgi:hypothetical protein